MMYAILEIPRDDTSAGEVSLQDEKGVVVARLPAPHAIFLLTEAGDRAMAKIDVIRTTANWRHNDDGTWSTFVDFRKNVQTQRSS